MVNYWLLLLLLLTLFLKVIIAIIVLRKLFYILIGVLKHLNCSLLSPTLIGPIIGLCPLLK